MLTERKKRFAKHYAETGNGAEAARRAGYSDKGNSAASKAHQLLSDVDVKREAMTWQERVGLTPDLIGSTVVDALTQREDLNASLRAAELGSKLLKLVDADVDARHVTLNLPAGMTMDDVVKLAALDAGESD